MNSRRGRDYVAVALVLLIAASVWLPTLGWGLPSRASDRALFGDRTPWTGEQILALTARPAGGDRGADVDANPIVDRSKPILLNDTDAKRAEIVRRYRLMSGQPDEFIQFKALAEMSGRSGLSKLDPRLYQYGGLWIYPVGGLVRGAMAVGLVERPPAGANAMAFYLDHPEVFGRFYVVARAYSAFWGFAALVAIFVLARQVTSHTWFAALAALAFALLPVVRTATHEAKPHLAGAALCLWAILAAGRFVDSRRTRWLIVAGVLCGASMSMVVSMLLSLVVLPTAWWLARRATRATGATTPTAVRSDDSSRGIDVTRAVRSDRTAVGVSALTLLLALACAAIVYGITNPFVLINAFANPSLLKSNLGNSTAMYGVGGIASSIVSVLRIAGNGLGALGVGLALLSFYAVLVTRWPVAPVSRLLLVAAAAFATQFAALAAGKPAEYARFGLIVAAGLCVSGAAGVVHAYVRPRAAVGRFDVRSSLGRLSLATILLMVLAVEWVPLAKPLTARRGLPELRRDAAGRPLRIATAYEPAPWSMPPLNLFADQLVLVPRDRPDMRSAFDAFIYPRNLAGQVRLNAAQERGDWRENEFLIVPARSPFDSAWPVSSAPAHPGSAPAE